MKNKFKTALIALIALPLLSLFLVSCEDDEPKIETKIVKELVDPTRYAISIDMKQKVNGNDLVLNTANKPYTTKNGEAFNVTKLRYLISDITFNKADGSSFTINEYHLVDISNSTTLQFNPTTKVPAGEYTSISFNFGFDREDNITNGYSDLTTVLWNWPMPLGGGYHFMQLEGKFDSLGTEKGFATHMGTARNITPTDTTFEDNHFVAKPIASAITIDGEKSFSIIMNVEQWYENPYTWDLNKYGLMIMPKYDAQRKLNLNGPSVFTVEI